MLTTSRGTRQLWLPYRGAPQTVDVIRDGALRSQQSYALRQLAEKICERIPSKDYVSEYLAVYYFVLTRTRYMRDPRTVELVRAPFVVAESILRGEKPSLDCDDMTALVAALCSAMGGETRATTVAFRNIFHNGHRQYSHVFAEARCPHSGAWICLDPVAAGRIDEMQRRVVAAKFWPIA